MRPSPVYFTTVPTSYEDGGYPGVSLPGGEGDVGSYKGEGDDGSNLGEGDDGSNLGEGDDGSNLGEGEGGAYSSYLLTNLDSPFSFCIVAISVSLLDFTIV